MKMTTPLECCSPQSIVEYLLLILFCEPLNDVGLILWLVMLLSYLRVQDNVWMACLL